MNGMITLAQNQPSEGSGSILIWLLVLVAVVIVGFVLVSWVRRKLTTPDEPAGGIGFSLGDLREMHRKGQISDEEFERAKTKMTAAMKAAAERKQPSAPKGGLPGT